MAGLRTIAACNASAEADRKPLNALALEAIGYTVACRALPRSVDPEIYSKADDAALDARDRFVARLLADTGMTRPLLDALLREGVL